MKYFFGNEESDPIIVGSLVNLKSNPNIFGTVLERMIEANEVKYRLQLNGRILTFPESMIELLKPKIDEKILAALEADFSSQPLNGDDTIDSIIDSPPLQDVQNEELNAVPEVPSTQKHFSFGSDEVNNVDVHSLGSSQEKIIYEEKHGDEDKEEEEYVIKEEVYHEDIIEKAIVNKKDNLQVLKNLNEKKYPVHQNKMPLSEQKESKPINPKKVPWPKYILILLIIGFLIYYLFDMYHAYKVDIAFQEMLLAKPSYTKIENNKDIDYTGNYYSNSLLGFKVRIPKLYMKGEKYQSGNITIQEFIHKTTGNKLQIRITDLYSSMQISNPQNLGNTTRQAFSFNTFSRTNMTNWYEGTIRNYFSSLEDNGYVITNKDTGIRQLNDNVLIYLNYTMTSESGEVFHRISYEFLDNGYTIQLVGYLDENIDINVVSDFLSSFEFF